MMPRTVLVLAAAMTAVALSPVARSAQVPDAREATVALDCRPASVSTLTDAEIGDFWLAYHPGRLLARLQPLMAAGNWREAKDSVMLREREALQLAPPATLERYRRELAEANRLFDKLLGLPFDQQSRFMADSVQPTRWQLGQNPATGAVPIFPGQGEILVTAETPSGERRALCWPAIALNRFFTLHRAPSRDSTVAALNALAAQWDSYIDNSYSQLPWELFLNGLGRSRRDWNPPRNQWVLLHPSVGLEVAGLRRQDLNRVDVAVLEGLGYLYYNQDYSRYVGISGVASFASQRAMALGGYLHLWFPQAKLGYLRRPHPDAKRRGSFLVSVDIYDLLTQVPTSLKEAKETALALRLGQGSGR